MKNSLWILFSFFLFCFSFYAKADFYRFDPHKGPFSRELSQFFDPIFNKGRMQVYRIKKKRELRRLPQDLLNHLVKIDKNEWKVFGPEELQDKWPHSLSVQSRLDKISETNIRDHLEFLVSRASRSMGTIGNQETVNYIERFFKKNHYKVNKSCFRQNACNIWGIKKGKIDEYILIEAHLDSVGAFKAGADDNASGTSGLLEMARLLSEKNYKRGLIIFATNGEENGLLGSKHFVKQAEASGLIINLLSKELFDFINCLIALYSKGLLSSN